LVATTNANESRARDYYKSDFNYKNNDRAEDGFKAKEYSNKPKENEFRNNNYNYKPRENNYKPKDNEYKTRDNNYRPRENEYKPRESSYKPRDNEYKPRENSYKPRENEFKPREYSYRSQDNDLKRRDISFKPREYEYKPKENSFKPRDNEYKNSFSSVKNKDFQKHSFIDKDDDLDHKGARGRKATEARVKSASGKDKEQQPDKFETIKRLEREKKAVQKKIREEDDSEKIKRSIPKQKKGSKIDWTKGYQYGLLDEEVDYSEYL
jgi:hypothetical protein